MWSASKNLNEQLKARAALILYREKGKHGDEEIQEQVEEEDSDWDDGKDALGRVSIKVTWIYLMQNRHTANLVCSRPRKHQRTESRSRCHLQTPPQSVSESETDPSGMNHQRLQASSIEF